LKKGVFYGCRALKHEQYLHNNKYWFQPDSRKICRRDDPRLVIKTLKNIVYINYGVVFQLEFRMPFGAF